MRQRTRSQAGFGLAALLVTGLIVAAIPAPAGADPDPADVAVAAVPPSNNTPAIADDRLLVTVVPGTSDAAADSIAANAGADLEDRAGDTLILDPTGTVPELRASAIESMPDVVAVEPNYTVTGFAAPNDPLWGDQYGLQDAQPAGIRADSSWRNSPGSRDVVVGVLDTGIALTHPDLVANLWTNRTGVRGCAYGTHGYNAIADTCVPADDGGHGSHVAGIVGATGNNGIGVTGVAQRASLMGLKMLDRFGSGNQATAVKAIDFALDAKAAGVNLRVLQASWGSEATTVALSSAIGRARDAGVLFVAAAGNGRSNQNPTPINLDLAGNDIFPCEDPGSNVICVAATDTLGTLGSFSNYGATTVDIGAPGANILSTVPQGVVSDCGNALYCEFFGTSMAAPMVSGAAVDVIAAEPALSVSALRTRLLSTGNRLPALSGKVANGRLDVCAAVPNCGGLPPAPPTKPTAVTATVGDGSVTMTWAQPDSNGNSFTIIGYDVEGPAGVTRLPLTSTGTTITGLTNNTNVVVRVRAVADSAGPWVEKTIRPHAGGYEVDGLGSLHRVEIGGNGPSAASGTPFFSQGLARGVAVVPEGTGGYIADAYGGLHRFRIGASSPLPPAATGGPYWLGWDIVRGVTLSPQGGGYVLDGYGGMHRFGIGDAEPPPAPSGNPYWQGWDIARGVTFTADGSGGYLADGFGGIHRFRVGSGALPPATTNGPYWLGWNIVRGITLVPGTGGGWVLDGFGGLHRFGAGGAGPSQPSSSPYWLGWDIARGVDA